MTFDELLKQNNVNIEPTKFVDDDPYKKYDNIVDAYHDVKQLSPDKVDGIAFYNEVIEFLNIKGLSVEKVLPRIYRSYGDVLTDDIFAKYSSTSDGTSMYDLAYDQGMRFMKAQMTHKFVVQYNELAKRIVVNRQASK